MSTTLDPTHPLENLSHLGDLGFELGWDYARHGLAPPARLRVVGHPVCEGWASGLPVHHRRTVPTSPVIRHWLRLRLNAWLHGEPVDLQSLTPHLLAKIIPRNHPEGASYCPITRCALRGIDSHPRQKTPHDAKVVRVNVEQPWSGNNVIVVGRNAADALATLTGSARQRLKQTLSLVQSLKSSASSSSTQPVVHGLHGAQWARLGVMLSMTTPMRHEQAACLPMLVLPPQQLQRLHPVQDLQAIITSQWLSPGWSQRRQHMENLIQGAQTRRALRRFLDHFVQRVLRSGHPEQALRWRWALEDTWRHAEVLDLWQGFALQIKPEEAISVRNHAKIAPTSDVTHHDQTVYLDALDSPAYRQHHCAEPCSAPARPRLHTEYTGTGHAG
jgi:hypothetical protein